MAEGNLAASCIYSRVLVEVKVLPLRFVYATAPTSSHHQWQPGEDAVASRGRQRGCCGGQAEFGEKIRQGKTEDAAAGEDSRASPTNRTRAAAPATAIKTIK